MGPAEATKALTEDVAAAKRTTALKKFTTIVEEKRREGVKRGKEKLFITFDTNFTV